MQHVKYIDKNWIKAQSGKKIFPFKNVMLSHHCTRHTHNHNPH